MCVFFINSACDFHCKKLRPQRVPSSKQTKNMCKHEENTVMENVSIMRSVTGNVSERSQPSRSWPGSGPWARAHCPDPGSGPGPGPFGMIFIFVACHNRISYDVQRLSCLCTIFNWNKSHAATSNRITP